MHIIVCIKQTPATANIQIDPKTGTLKREGMAAAINPFDEYAIEEAVRIKERLPGSTVSVVTMGPPQAEDALREAIARGADDAYHVTDRAFAGADTYATSYTLQMAIRKIAETKKPFDLIICGKQTNDGDTGHVGPGIAAWLEIPNVAYVGKVEEVKEGSIRVRRMMEDGYDVLEMPTPALMSVVKEINEPRLASLKGKLAAKKAAVTKWNADDLKADRSKIGLSGSPTIVARSFNPPPRKGGEKIEGATPEEKAKKLVARLKELKVI
jgi:electron transfer flavoprotein beta subunit